MNPTPPPDAIEPIAPEAARQLLEAAIRERLGENWDEGEEGWTLLDSHDYMARLNRGRVNLDFYVDLLGNVHVEEKRLSPVQESGRIVAALLILVSIVLAIVLAQLARAIAP